MHYYLKSPLGLNLKPPVRAKVHVESYIDRKLTYKVVTSSTLN